MNGAQRLGKNINGYFGEKIDIKPVLAACIAAGQRHGWHVQEISIPSKPNLLALSRSLPEHQGPQGTTEARPQPCVYISAGIHGDEPAGPLAVRQLLEENLWPPNANLWLVPCLNPTGFLLHRRENAEGVDLNRQYLQPEANEVKAHVTWLKAQPAFDLCLALHEDWESHGFYVYELNPDNQPSLSETIVARVAEVCPVDPSSEIEGRPAYNGIIRPSVDPRSRPQWPESFYLLDQKTRLAYTLEAPSDFPLAVRVSALVTGVRAAVEQHAQSNTNSSATQGSLSP